MMIELISDHPELIPVLTKWYQSEWGPYYSEGGPGDARADLESRCNRDKLPIGLVAMKDGQACGTVALDLDVATNLAPSVVGLLVQPSYRRRGIATLLLDAAEHRARQLGYRRLYISTAVLGEHLSRSGWTAMGAVEFLNAAQGSVYVRDLG